MKYHVLQFAKCHEKCHEKFELVSSSLSNERNTGMKTRRYIRHDNLFVFGTISRSESNFIPSERLKRRANIPIENKAN